MAVIDTLHISLSINTNIQSFTVSILYHYSFPPSYIYLSCLHTLTNHSVLNVCQKLLCDSVCTNSDIYLESAFERATDYYFPKKLVDLLTRFGNCSSLTMYKAFLEIFGSNKYLTTHLLIPSCTCTQKETCFKRLKNKLSPL